MKLICVGVGPCRCLVLRFRKANILLDCATPLHAALCALGGDCHSGGHGDADGDNDNTADGCAGAARHGAAAAAAAAATSAAATAGDHSLDAALGSAPSAGCITQPGSIAAAVQVAAPPTLAEEPSPSLPPALPGGGSGGGGGNDSEDTGRGPDLLDLTPFLPLLHTLELHAALLSSPEALLALPHLLQYDDAVHMYGCEADRRENDSLRGSRSAAGSAAVDVGALPRVPWHHLGPIRGPVYCTRAALDAAEQLLAERLAAEEAVAAAAAAAAAVPPSQQQQHLQLPGRAGLGLGPLPDAQEALLTSCWRSRPPWSAVRYCLDRVRPVRYGQVVSLDSYELTAVPYPSGSGFGHAVWQVADGTERCRTVLYLPDAAPWHPFVPPLPLELVAAPDVLVLGPDCLQGGPSLPPCAPQQQQPLTAALPPPPIAMPTATRPPMQLIKEAVLRAVVAGGSVLIPVYATGEAWELIEALAGALASADLTHVPLLLVGPRARSSLALASVSLEALVPERQAAVYVPQHPFAFDALMQAGRLVAATSLRDPAAQRCLHQQPAVVLAAADSLLYPGGPALELLLRFGPHRNHLMLLPHAAPPAALRGIQRVYDRAAAAAAAPPPSPLRMRVVHVPLRGGAAAAGPSPASVLELLSRLQPRHLLATNRDLELLFRVQQQHQLQQQQKQQQQASGPPPPLARESVVPYDWLHQARVSLPRNVHSAMVSPDLLQRLQWLGGGPGLQLARLSCILVFRDGAWHADPVPRSAAGGADSVAAAAALAAGGTVAADQLLLAAEGGPELGPVLEALAERGITRVSVKTERQLVRLALYGTDAELLLRPGGAHVQASCPALRHLLTECLMRQLTTI